MRRWKGLVMICKALPPPYISSLLGNAVENQRDLEIVFPQMKMLWKACKALGFAYAAKKNNKIKLNIQNL